MRMTRDMGMRKLRRKKTVKKLRPAELEGSTFCWEGNSLYRNVRARIAKVIFGVDYGIANAACCAYQSKNDKKDKLYMIEFLFYLTHFMMNFSNCTKDYPWF
jgi:hypothetical protein